MTRSVFIDRSLSERESQEDVINRYIKHIAPKHKAGKAEIARLKKFLQDKQDLTCRIMATLTIEDFESYRDKRLNENKAPGTVKRELGLLPSVIESSLRRLGLLENAVTKVKRPKVNDNRIMRFYGYEEATGE